MGAAESLPTPLTESLSWAEIQARFPYQYVVVLEDDPDNIHGGMDSVRGRVLDNDISRRALARRNPVRDDPNVLVGFYYTGVGMPHEDRDPIILHR